MTTTDLVDMRVVVVEVVVPVAVAVKSLLLLLLLLLLVQLLLLCALKREVNVGDADTVVPSLRTVDMDVPSGVVRCVSCYFPFDHTGTLVIVEQKLQCHTHTEYICYIYI